MLAPGAVRAIGPVVAATTGSFQCNPLTAESSCDLFTASLASIPAAKLTILLPTALLPTVIASLRLTA